MYDQISKYFKKRKNRFILLKLQIIKVLFYPAIILLDKVKLLPIIQSLLNKLLPILGISKNINHFFQYKDYGYWFKDDFTANNNEKILLFPSMLGANSNLIMINLLFAKYFQNNGFKPIFVICNAAVPICNRERINKSRKTNPFFCQECWKGFKHIQRETGLAVIYFEELFDQQMTAFYSKEEFTIDAFETIEDCIDYKYENVSIGQITKKSVLRYLLQGRLYGNQHEILLYKMFLKSSLKEYLIIRKLFMDLTNLNNIIINNGTLAFETLVRNFAEENSIDYMTYDTFLGNNSIIYKKNDEVMNLDWDKERQIFEKKYQTTLNMENLVDDFFTGLKSGKDLYARLNVDHNTSALSGVERYACLFTNLNFDTAVIDKNTIFNSMEDWIFSVIKFWESKVQNVELVIRIHPGELKLSTATKEFMGDRIRERIKSDKIILYDAEESVNSYELIKDMDFGLVYSSTIGLEIAYHGIICVVGGRPYYRNKNFVVNPDNKDEYFNVLDKLIHKNYKFKIDRDELIRLIYHTYFVRNKRLKGIKVRTPFAEPNSIYTNSSDMLKNNKKFFAEFFAEMIEE